MSTKPSAQKIVVLRQQYRNDVATVVDCCAEAIACSRVTEPKDPLFETLKCQPGADLVMFGSGGSSMLASQVSADVTQLAGGHHNTGHILHISDGQHSVPRPSQLTHGSHEDLHLEEAVEGVSCLCSYAVLFV